MSVTIGQLLKKSTIRRLNGQIVKLVDEENGGVIIDKGQVVNEVRYKELQAIEEDRRRAAEAVQHQIVVSAQLEAQRTAQPSKLEEIEKRQDETDAKLDMILSLLQDKKKKK
jgi:hypothetical protein